MLCCAICRAKLFTEDPKKYFCRDCYKQWKSEILSKADWITFCINDEHRQRRQALKDNGKLVYLGDRFDISDGKLIPLRAYYEQED